MKAKIRFRTQRGAAQLRRFFSGQGCPAPSMVLLPALDVWAATLLPIHQQQLRALMIGWGDMRRAQKMARAAV